MIQQGDPALYAGSSTPDDLAPVSKEESDTMSSMVKPAMSPMSPALDPIVTLPAKEPERTILPEGKTLRLLAEDIFGHREFWVYIYLENRDRIDNPNKVPSGIELLLPDKSIYSMNAEDPQSVAKAKSLGDEVLENF